MSIADSLVGAKMAVGPVSDILNETRFRDVVHVPIRNDQLSFTSIGSQSAPLLRRGDGTIKDGWGTELRVNVNPDTQGNAGTRIALRFRGNVFGIGFELIPVSGASQIWPIGCFIDKQAFPVDTMQRRNPLNMSAIAVDNSRFPGVIIATDLGDGDHDAELIFPCDISAGGITRRWSLQRFIFERAAGYSDIAPFIDLSSPEIVVSSTARTELVVSTHTGFSGSYTFSHPTGTWGLRRMYLANPTAAPIVFQLFTSAAAASPFYVKTIAAGDTFELDFRAPVFGTTTNQNTLFYQASASGLIIKPIGEE